MRSQPTILLLAFALTLAAGPAGAQFRASDLIYLPAVAHTTGTNDSVWTSDVIITNVEPEDAIDVAVVFVPSGSTSRSYLFNDRSAWLGGREEDSFGIVDEALADIPPGGFVVLEDVVGEYWLGEGGGNEQGALIVFSYLADSLADDGSREYRNCTVSSRIYNTGILWIPDPDNEGEFLESDVTYGQGFDGVPWYNLADGGFKDEETGLDYSYLVLDGGRHTGDFRYNLGFMNTSDRQTSITLVVQPIAPDGEPLTDDEGNGLMVVIALPPLANVNYNSILFNVWSLTDIEAARFKVSLAEWTTTGIDPRPTFTAFGSLIDNRNNDPATFAPTFAMPYDVDCVWPAGDDGTGGDGKGARHSARPVSIPAVASPAS